MPGATWVRNRDWPLAYEKPIELGNRSVGLFYVVSRKIADRIRDYLDAGLDAESDYPLKCVHWAFPDGIGEPGR
jgi:hypothetical protein